jgi:peptidoglycan hydrolase-like protein with peptidoglycan-binding domain
MKEVPSMSGRSIACRAASRAAIALTLTLLVTPAPAQDRIGPAPAIRVVELVDASGTRLERTVLEPMTPAEILRLQVALSGAGYDPGVRSGVVDAETATALRQFQLARGLDACGCPSYETILALGVPVDVVGRAEIRRATGIRTAAGEGVYVVDSGLLPAGFLPGFFLHDDIFRKHRHRHPPFVGSGVVVGGEPALGAGQLHRGIPRSSVAVREIQPPARSTAKSRGATLQPAVPGARDGGGRPPRPRP